LLADNSEMQELLPSTYIHVTLFYRHKIIDVSRLLTACLEKVVIIEGGLFKKMWIGKYASKNLFTSTIERSFYDLIEDEI